MPEPIVREHTETLSVVVREGDMVTLRELAEAEWRDTVDIQASAVIEQALAEYRKRTATIEKLKNTIASNKSQNGVNRGRVLAEAT